MDIEIPSPSIFLQRTPPASSTIPPVPIRKSAKQRGIESTKVQTKPHTTSVSANSQSAAPTKPKQSKSRNGCMTCKKKRLKCDETKPTCVQCERRNVECEGYKKDYKWRSFEETSKQSKAGKAKKVASTSFDFDDHGAVPCPAGTLKIPKENRAPQIQSLTLQDAFSSAVYALTETQPLTYATESPPGRVDTSQFEPLPMLNPGFSPSNMHLPQRSPHTDTSNSRVSENSRSHSPSFTGSPTLADLLIPGTDMSQPPDSSEVRPPMSPLPYQPGLADTTTSQGIIINADEDFDEEVIRDDMDDSGGRIPDLMKDQFHARTMSESPWIYRTASIESASSMSPQMSISRSPKLDLCSTDMLMLRFDRHTCGILSIKNGDAENPWKTSIWPLAKDYDALFHAVSSMAALHGATHNPELRAAGIAHMTKSMNKLSNDIHNMSLDAALATSLALALGEGWDEKISTGIQHLKGAGVMVNRAIVQKHRYKQLGQADEEASRRLKFLCNTYVYMDVIARLSSADGDDSVDLGELIDTMNEPFNGGAVEIDPLMGCATTLFPVIGKVASLVQRVRNTNSNSLQIVSDANELREQLLNWHPPDIDFVEQPQDTSIKIEDAIRTAEAYQYATLLHLYQAVPELATESAHAQAKHILTIIASTPLSSRTTIIQIFPLLVGSCEMVSSEDREWVRQRWQGMMKRLSIVNVQSCYKLVQEVWRRRDAQVEEQVRRLSARQFGRGIPLSMRMPPSLKRKLTTGDIDSEEAMMVMSDAMQQDSNSRPPKRRLTFDTSTAFGVRSGGIGNSFLHGRRHPNMAGSSIDPEYTVRGHLHWLGVMSGWQWEVFLG